MIAQNIAYNAVQAGHSALFVTASQMLLDLSAQESARGLDRCPRYSANKVKVLVIDEIGYLSYDARNADLLYQVVSRRYEKGVLDASHHRMHLPQPRIGRDEPDLLGSGSNQPLDLPEQIPGQNRDEIIFR